MTQLTPSPCHLDLVERPQATPREHDRAAVVAYLRRLAREERLRIPHWCGAESTALRLSTRAAALDEAARGIEEGRHL